MFQLTDFFFNESTDLRAIYINNSIIFFIVNREGLRWFSKFDFGVKIIL